MSVLGVYFFSIFQEANRLENLTLNEGSETARFGKIELDLVGTKLENVSPKSNFKNYFLTHTFLHMDEIHVDNISTLHTELMLIFMKRE